MTRKRASRAQKGGKAATNNNTAEGGANQQPKSRAPRVEPAKLPEIDDESSEVIDQGKSSCASVLF